MEQQPRKVVHREAISSDKEVREKTLDAPIDERSSWWRDYAADVSFATSGRSRTHQLITLPLVDAGVRALLFYRWSRRLVMSRWCAPLSSLIKRVGMLTTRAEIHPRANLEPGIRFPHPQGVVIGPGVCIGSRSTIFQDVTIGPRTTEETPVLESGTRVHAGAKVLGPIRIGAGSEIGPNCVVFRDLDPASRVDAASGLVETAEASS